MIRHSPTVLIRAFPALMVILCCGVPWKAPAVPVPRRQLFIRALLDENGKALLKQMTNPTGDPGQGFVETEVVYSGKSSVRIVPMQRFHPSLPGWKFPIRNNPRPGEYRYLRFAWKSEGCRGIMIQFHDEKGWNLRYVAGIDKYGWGSKTVAGVPPKKWTIVTCDLHKDFGDRILSGMALTAFDGKAAWFDHVCLGRTIADLDRYQKRALAGKEPRE